MCMSRLQSVGENTQDADSGQDVWVQGLVMMVQNRYQRRRMYTRIALGKNRAMDVVSGESSGGSGQLLFLYPLLFSLQILQCWIGAPCFSVLSHIFPLLIPMSMGASPPGDTLLWHLPGSFSSCRKHVKVEASGLICLLKRKCHGRASARDQRKGCLAFAIKSLNENELHGGQGPAC